MMTLVTMMMMMMMIVDKLNKYPVVKCYLPHLEYYSEYFPPVSYIKITFYSCSFPFLSISVFVFISLHVAFDTFSVFATIIINFIRLQKQRCAEVKKGGRGDSATAGVYERIANAIRAQRNFYFAMQLLIMIYLC